MPCRASLRKGFTLVELIVVVAIIAVLIALLLPMMAKARDVATRAACASDRHQNYLALALYTSDNRQRLPETYLDNWSHGASDAASLASSKPAWQRADNRFSLGTLVDAGYVDEPSTLFCPAFVRLQKTFRPLVKGGVPSQYFDQPDLIRRWNEIGRVPWKDEPEPPRFRDGHADFWQNELNRPGIQGRLTRNVYTGITVYSIAYRPNEDHRIGDKERILWGDAGLTINEIASHWNDSWIPGSGRFQGTSPMLVSCANYSGPPNSGFSRNGHYSDKLDQGWSHDLRGVNGAMFDGSVRWISAEEHGGNFKNAEMTLHATPMQKWALHSLNLTGR